MVLFVQFHLRMVISMLPTKILGFGRYLPRKSTHAEELDQQLSLPVGTVEKKSGLCTRYFASDDESASFMAAQAALQALKHAGIHATDLDVIISACGVSEQLLPCTAALVQRQLGLTGTGIACFDVNSTCLSFVTALDIASHFIAAGRYQRVLIVSGDLPSAALNWNDLGASAIFSDGAAACILTKGDGSSSILASHFETYSEGIDDCCIKAGGSRIPPAKPFDPNLGLFHMDGKRIFKLASKVLDGVHARILEKANITMDAIDFVIPHQASQLAMDHIRKRLDIPDHKFVDVFAQYGNQVASSIPNALAVLAESGKLQRGNIVYLLGTGAGLSAGATILRY